MKVTSHPRQRRLARGTVSLRGASIQRPLLARPTPRRPRTRAGTDARAYASIRAQQTRRLVAITTRTRGWRDCAQGAPRAACPSDEHIVRHGTARADRKHRPAGPQWRYEYAERRDIIHAHCCGISHTASRMVNVVPRPPSTPPRPPLGHDRRHRHRTRRRRRRERRTSRSAPGRPRCATT